MPSREGKGIEKARERRGGDWPNEGVEAEGVSPVGVVPAESPFSPTGGLPDSLET